MLGFIAFFAASVFMVLIVSSIPTALLPSGFKILLLIIAFFIDAVAISTRFYSYLITPLIKQRKRHIVLSNEDAYWLSVSGDAILHREGEQYVATVYIKIPIYVSATEMTPEEKLEFTSQMAKLLSVGDTPTRYTTQIHIMNKDSYIDTLRNMMNSSENEEAKMMSSNASQKDLERVKGKVSMWHHIMDNASSTLSLEQVTYAAISSIGSKEFEAVSGVQQKAREAMSGISAVLGVTPSVMTGESILRFVEPEYLIPYSTVSEQISKSMREEVL